jgi:hypothetical protein
MPLYFFSFLNLDQNNENIKNCKLMLEVFISQFMRLISSNRLTISDCFNLVRFNVNDQSRRHIFNDRHIGNAEHKH